MKISNYILLFIITLLAAPVLSQTSFKPFKDTTFFKTKLAEMSNKTKTIESDFVQEKNLSVLSEKIISKGHLCFKQKNKVRWEYTEPFKYLIIINNDKFHIKDDVNEKTYDINSNKVFREVNKIIIGSIQGNLLNSKDFKCEILKGGKYYLVKLYPLQKELKVFLKRIEIYIDTSDYTVSKVKMFEFSGDYTFITFSNKKLNENISDEKFTF